MRGFARNSASASLLIRSSVAENCGTVRIANWPANRLPRLPRRGVARVVAVEVCVDSRWRIVGRRVVAVRSVAVGRLRASLVSGLDVVDVVDLLLDAGFDSHAAGTRL